MGCLPCAGARGVAEDEKRLSEAMFGDELQRIHHWGDWEPNLGYSDTVDARRSRRVTL